MAPGQEQPNFWDFIKRFDQGNSQGAQPNAPFNPYAAHPPGPETGRARPAPPPPPYGPGFPFENLPGEPHPFATGFQWGADPRAFWAAAQGRHHHGRGRHGDHGRHGGNDNNERARSPSPARSQTEGVTDEKEKDKGKDKEKEDLIMSDRDAWRAHWRPDGDWSRGRDWGRGWGGWGRWDERSRSRSHSRSRSRSPNGEHTESSEESCRDRKGRGRREHCRRRHGHHGFPGRGGFGGGFGAYGPWGSAAFGAPGGRDWERAFKRWNRHGARGFVARPSGNNSNGAFDMKAMFDSISQNPLARVFRNFMENQQKQNPATGERLAPEDAHDDDNTFVPAIDIFATEQAYILHVSLPGAKKEDIGVNWDAEKQLLSLAGVVYRQGDEKFLQTLVPGRSERRVGVFDRTVRLPPITVMTTNADEAPEGRKEEIDGDGITAKLEDGVLVVTVPKIEREDAFVEVKKIDIA